MKIEFLEPEVTVLKIEDTNVICTSDTKCGKNTGGNEVSVDWF